MCGTNLITKELLLNHLSYNKTSGKMFWKNPTSNRVKVGQEVGTLCNTGHLKVRLIGKSLYLHRLIWFLEMGKWPDKHIDHVNKNKTDNRFTNLRECDDLLNSINRSRGGLMGCYFSKQKQKWIVDSKLNGVRKTKGGFNTEYEAHRYYKDVLLKSYNTKDLEDFGIDL